MKKECRVYLVIMIVVLVLSWSSKFTMSIDTSLVSLLWVLSGTFGLGFLLQTVNNPKYKAPALALIFVWFLMSSLIMHLMRISSAIVPEFLLIYSIIRTSLGIVISVIVFLWNSFPSNKKIKKYGHDSKSCPFLFI
jgi:hypothetical protein